MIRRFFEWLFPSRWIVRIESVAFVYYIAGRYSISPYRDTASHFKSKIHAEEAMNGCVNKLNKQNPGEITKEK